MRPTGNCAGYVTSRWLLLRIPGPASVTCLRRPSQSRRRRVIDLHDNDVGLFAQVLVFDAALNLAAEN